MTYGDADRRSGRLSVRPPRPDGAGGPPRPTPPGSGVLWPFGQEGESAGLFVPSTLPDVPVPLVVMLHGAGSVPGRILPVIEEVAESQGVLVLAPKSVGATWDVIRGGFGPDVAELDRTLGYVFDSYAVDAGRLAVGGFSDGASYALSVGLINGDLFTHVFAFSPGFVAPGPWQGAPSVFVSHGTQDQVLPIERCSRRIVPALRLEGYGVDYREFVGGHTVPPEMVAAAVEHIR